MLAYLSRYTHRVAIANSRLVALDDAGVTFRWKDYRAKGRERAKVMTLAIDEFIRRFLIHVLPGGFHRIRHYGLFANGGRAENIARARQLLSVRRHGRSSDAGGAGDSEPQALAHPCPCCGGRMIIIETFERGCAPRTPADGPDQDRHLMIAVARSRRPKAWRRRSTGDAGAWPSHIGRRQITPSRSALAPRRLLPSACPPQSHAARPALPSYRQHHKQRPAALKSP